MTKTSTTKYALIMAAGDGRRAGTEIPKQFIKLLGIPMLWWSVMAFHREDPSTRIRIVMNPAFFDDWDLLLEEIPEEYRDIPFELICGGKTRGESVHNGITGIPDTNDTLIAVHDAARPLVTPEMIAKGWETAKENSTAVPVVPVTDSIRELTPDGSVCVDRSRFVAVQTPQIARADILHAAYELEERPIFTDDASRIEALGIPISLYDGDPRNIKVTNPDDFTIATALLSKTSPLKDPASNQNEL